MAALRSAPPPAGVPKPATFMAAPEKLRVAIPVSAPVEPEVKPAMPVMPAPVEPVATAVAEVASLPEAPAFKDEGCPELRAMIDEREAKKQTTQKRQSLAVTLSLLAMLAAAGGWFAVSPSAQAKVAKVVPLFKESLRDVKALANTKENFDKQLEQVGSRNNQIDDATRALGVDPTTVPDEAGAELDTALQDMMGGEGRTTSERNKEVQEKLGVVGKLLGDKKQ